MRYSGVGRRRSVLEVFRAYRRMREWRRSVLASRMQERRRYMLAGWTRVVLWGGAAAIHQLDQLEAWQW
jgi:hypothetical protein